LNVKGKVPIICITLSQLQTELSYVGDRLHLLPLPYTAVTFLVFSWYQIILLGDRGTCMWTICPVTTWQWNSRGQTCNLSFASLMP